MVRGVEGERSCGCGMLERVDVARDATRSRGNGGATLVRLDHVPPAPVVAFREEPDLEGLGFGEDWDRRARLRWYDEGAREGSDCDCVPGEENNAMQGESNTISISYVFDRFRVMRKSTYVCHPLGE